MEYAIEKEYKGIWVFAEQLEGKLSPVSLELAGEAARLSKLLNTRVSAVLLGDKVEQLTKELIEHGADDVYIIDHPVFHYYRGEVYSGAFCQLVDQYKPEILLMGATTTGRDLAGAVATTLRTGLTADCTALDIDAESGILLASRPAFGGNIMATITCKEHRPQMATVRPKVMKMPPREESRTGRIIRETYHQPENPFKTTVLKIVKENLENIRLEDSPIIIAGGRGIQNEQGQKLIQELALVLGGVVGGSRGAVEKGLIGPGQQIGQTGKTVAPKLYFAIGISGAIQHTVGIAGAETIVAINTDGECPMMKMATYSIACDALEILPPLIDAFKQGLSEIKDTHAA